MLISFSDSVSLGVSGTEAEAPAAEGLWGDLNAVPGLSVSVTGLSVVVYGLSV